MARTPAQILKRLEGKLKNKQAKAAKAKKKAAIKSRIEAVRKQLAK